MTQDISQKFVEANSPFNLNQVLEDKKVACDFIEWTLLRIDYRLEAFDPQSIGTNYILNLTKKLERTQILAQKLSSIGLCKPTETDLIEATAPHNRLFQFYSNLFTLLKAACVINDDDSQRVSNNESKMNDIQKSFVLMDELTLNCDNIHKIFNKEFELFPKDVTLMIGKAKDEKNNIGKVDINVLQSFKEQEFQLIQSLKEELARVEGEQTLDKFSRVSEELISQLTKFSIIHDEEIGPWIKKDSIERNEKKVIQGLGQQTHEARNKLEKLHQILKDLETIHTSCENILSHLQSTLETQETRNNLIQPKIFRINMQGETGSEAIVKLQSIEKSLKDGIVRRERGGSCLKLMIRAKPETEIVLPRGGNANGLQKDIRPIREKQYQSESIKIIADYLNEVEYKYVVDERLFQMPTAKEYHAIFKFVFQRLEPGRDIAKIEEIVNILRWIKYPYSHEISKSSLQAVGNVQTWPNLLGALRWLVEFIATWETIDQLEKEAEEEPAPFNPDTAFFTYVTKAYNVFLEEQSNADIVVQTAELQKKVDELEKEMNEMNEEDPLTTVINENNTLLSDMAKFNAYTKHLEDKINKLKDSITKLEEQNQGADLAKIEEEKAEIQQKVDSQPISPDDVERMHKESEQITNNRNSIAAKMKELAKLQWEKGLELEKRISEIEKQIQYYNTGLYRVGMLPSSAQYAKGENYEISLDTDVDRIDKMISLDLRNFVTACSSNSSIKVKISEVRESFNCEYDKTQEQINQISEEIHHITDDIADKEMDLKTLEENKSILTRQFEEVKQLEQNEADSLTKRCANFEQRVGQLRSEGASVYVEWKQKRQEIQIQFDRCQQEYNAARESTYNEFNQIKNEQLRNQQHISNVLLDLKRLSENELNEVKK
ncbi:5442_t:CDS:10 [Diversispora eburnea]|uniref:5442_t:CDS:1 n=1 Tax=Diversispora eburnea TaxID=1213867 RepID=A0A9N9FAF6_9GLOM|nr:5442_t:CDS:10 [Diversispora eburnea]